MAAGIVLRDLEKKTFQYWPTSTNDFDDELTDNVIKLRNENFNVIMQSNVSKEGIEDLGFKEEPGLFLRLSKEYSEKCPNKKLSPRFI